MTRRRTPADRNQSDKPGLARKDGVKRRPGRSPVHAESWTKVTVVLFDRQVQFLDRLAASIRGEQGVSISRAQVIRALVDSVRDSLGESGEAAVAPVATADSGAGVELNQAMLARLGVVRRKS